ncbi:MAG: hypothetical protein LBM71_03875, partial [Elusimicrobiota bacterium]|nr:hypothetical protein [Elusimicrobiota bacterium]
SSSQGKENAPPPEEIEREIFQGSEGAEFHGMQVSEHEEGSASGHRPSAIENENNLKRLFSRTTRSTELDPPPGFFASLTNNYLVHREQVQVTPELKTLLDNIHGNFVLDIIPFSLFSKFERIFLMLFRTKEKYTGFTSRPPWSIATTNIEEQSIYIMENNEFNSNFVHELSHIYYDGFFKPTITPLWLSEGYATYMQVNAQTPEQRTWINHGLNTFLSGEYIAFDEFVNAENLKSYQQDDVLLWYVQAYSVINYLLKTKSKDEFYQFSKNLKDGMPVTRAMYRAYGMPFNTLSALEHAWYADLINTAKQEKRGQG